MVAPDVANVSVRVRNPSLAFTESGKMGEWIMPAVPKTVTRKGRKFESYFFRVRRCGRKVHAAVCKTVYGVSESPAVF